MMKKSFCSAKVSLISFFQQKNIGIFGYKVVMSLPLSEVNKLTCFEQLQPGPLVSELVITIHQMFQDILRL